jgi:hypothetical protein
MGSMGIQEPLLQRFRTHSPRIGGASALANKGAPDYVIQRLGRWKSLAFLDYLRLAAAAFEAALVSLTDVSSLTLLDVLRQNSAAAVTNVTI